LWDVFFAFFTSFLLSLQSSHLKFFLKIIQRWVYANCEIKILCRSKDSTALGKEAVTTSAKELERKHKMAASPGIALLILRAFVLDAVYI